MRQSIGMSQETWTAVDEYFDGLLAPPDGALDEAARASREAGLPQISVSPGQGKLLQVLALAVGARRILEVGTLGGYSTIWLARALPPGGRLITLEASPLHAEVAGANIRRAGLAEVVQVRLGPARDTLAELIGAAAEPFDLIFIDADKSGYPGYLELSLRLSRRVTMIVGDIVARGGKVADPASDDADVRGVRAFLEQIAAHPRLAGAASQTVGSKGYDGFALAVVLGEAG